MEKPCAEKERSVGSSNVLSFDRQRMNSIVADKMESVPPMGVR